MRLFRRFDDLLLCTVPLLVLHGAAAHAQTPGAYPARTVRIIVPVTPAGATDILARLLAQRLTAVAATWVLRRQRWRPLMATRC